MMFLQQEREFLSLRAVLKPDMITRANINFVL
jgi:hypothetical protein